jgi:hypothetical protein
MSGYYDKSTLDGCWDKAKNNIDNQVYDYTLYRPAVMRINRIEAPFMMPAQNVDFYGPLAGNRVTKESFLMGRGATLSKCPDCEVNYLPSSLFNQPPVKSQCDRVDLLPMFTRVKPTCNGLKQTDVSEYAFSAGAYAGDYAGINAVTYSNLQTRVGPDYAPNKYEKCRETYASYAPSRDFSKYSP